MESQPTYCVLTFPSESRGEMRLRGEGLSLNAAFYSGSKRELVGGGVKFSVTPKSHGLQKKSV